MNSGSINTLLNARYVPGVMPLVYTYVIPFHQSPLPYLYFADVKKQDIGN